MDWQKHQNSGWLPSGLPIIGLAAVVSIIGMSYGAITFRQLALNAQLFHPDFYGIWSFSRFAHVYNVDQLYNDHALFAYQHKLALHFHGFYPFAYPPCFLLVIWPLGFVNYGIALLLWNTLTFLMFALSIYGIILKVGIKHNILILFVLLSPPSILNAVLGETGYLTASLLIGGFAVLQKRPAVAGIIFGLLAIKPQTAVLIPCALLGIGSWRAFVSAALTVTTLILLSGALFSYHLWLTFLDNLPTYQSAMMHNTKTKSLMTTIEAASEVLGVPNTVAVFFQAGASITVGAIIYFVFRKCSYISAVALFIMGSTIASPHAYIYDTPEIPL